MRRRFLLLAAALAAAVAVPAAAHHGLTLWDEDTPTAVDGFISHELTGFPHWEIKIRDANGDDWRIDLGSSFEMEKAGLREDGSDLPIGTEVHVDGHRPRNSDKLLIRPDRVVTKHKTYSSAATGTDRGAQGAAGRRTSRPGVRRGLPPADGRATSPRRAVLRGTGGSATRRPAQGARRLRSRR